jgi:hypothetical protein
MGLMIGKFRGLFSGYFGKGDWDGDIVGGWIGFERGLRRAYEI